jgi:hypothetical protein
MSTKIVPTSLLWLAMLGACTARAGDLLPTVIPGAYPGGRAVELVPPSGQQAKELAATSNGNEESPGVSPWIKYSQPNCCGPIGGSGPITYELFFRGGLTLPEAGTWLDDHKLSPGWMFQVGGRSMFFDAAEIRAWTVEIAVSHTYNTGEGNQTPVTLFNGDNVTVRDLHRTDVTFSFGREYYLIGEARSHDNPRWRVGWDGGIRWGTTRLDTNDPHETVTGSLFRRVNSWNWGPVVAFHTDMEFPHGCCSFVVGARGEWDTIFNHHLLPADDGQISSVNLLLTLGVRY